MIGSEALGLEFQLLHPIETEATDGNQCGIRILSSLRSAMLQNMLPGQHLGATCTVAERSSATRHYDGQYP